MMNFSCDGVMGTQVKTQTVYAVPSLPDLWINNVVQTHSRMLLSLQKGWHALSTITQINLKDILSKATQT